MLFKTQQRIAEILVIIFAALVLICLSLDINDLIDQKRKVPEFYVKDINATVRVETPFSRGTGFCIKKNDNNTLFLTCAHVVKSSVEFFGIDVEIPGNMATENIKLLTYDGHYLKGNLLAKDTRKDLALISANCSIEFMEPLSIDMSERLVGDEIYATGHPGGFVFQTNWGHISLSKSMPGITSSLELPLDFPCYGGFSGSAVCRLGTADVIGMLDSNVEYTHITRAITADTIKLFLDAQGI